MFLENKKSIKGRDQLIAKSYKGYTFLSFETYYRVVEAERQWQSTAHLFAQWILDFNTSFTRSSEQSHGLMMIVRSSCTTDWLRNSYLDGRKELWTQSTWLDELEDEEHLGLNECLPYHRTVMGRHDHGIAYAIEKPKDYLSPLHLFPVDIHQAVSGEKRRSKASIKIVPQNMQDATIHHLGLEFSEGLVSIVMYAQIL